MTDSDDLSTFDDDSISSSDDLTSEMSQPLDGPSRLQLLHYLSILEGEIQARDLVIATLRTRFENAINQEEPLFALLRDCQYVNFNNLKDENCDNVHVGAYAKKAHGIVTVYEDASLKLGSIAYKYRYMCNKFTLFVNNLKKQHEQILAEFGALKQHEQDDILEANKVVTALQLIQQDLISQLEVEKDKQKGLLEEIIKIRQEFICERVKSEKLKGLFVKDREKLRHALEQNKLMNLKIKEETENDKKKMQELNEKLLIHADQTQRRTEEIEEKNKLLSKIKEENTELKFALNDCKNTIDNLLRELVQKNSRIDELQDTLVHTRSFDNGNHLYSNSSESIDKGSYTNKGESALTAHDDESAADSETIHSVEATSDKSLSSGDSKNKCPPPLPTRVSSLENSNEAVNLVKVTIVKNKSDTATSIDSKSLSMNNISSAIPAYSSKKSISSDNLLCERESDEMTMKLLTQNLDKSENEKINNTPSKSIETLVGENSPSLHKRQSDGMLTTSTESLDASSAHTVKTTTKSLKSSESQQKTMNREQSKDFSTEMLPSASKYGGSSSDPISLNSNCCVEDEIEKMLSLLQVSSGLLQRTVMSPLQVAVLRGDFNYLNGLMIDRNLSDLVNIGNNDGTTSIHIAAATGQTECLSFLLENGGNPNVLRADKISPLHFAAMEGHLKCATILLEFGAAPTTVDRCGWTPLYLAATNGHLECLQLLLSAGGFENSAVTFAGGWTPLHGAVRYNQVGALKTMLRHITLSEERNDDCSCIINAVDDDGWCPAHVASANGFKESLAFLLSTGKVELALTDKLGRTVSDVAATECHDVLSKYMYRKVVVFVNTATSMLRKGKSCISIANFNVTTAWNWRDIDKAINALLLTYSKAISSGKFTDKDQIERQILNLSINSVWSYQCGIYSWSPGESPSDVAIDPYELFRKTERNHLDRKQIKSMKYSKLVVNLKGCECRRLDRLAFESLVALPLLQSYLRMIEEHKSVIFYGPPGTGKVYLATKLAQFIHMEKRNSNPEIHHISLNRAHRRRDIIELLYKRHLLIPVSSAVDSTYRQGISVLIIDNLAQVSMTSFLGELLQIINCRGPSHTVNIKTVEITLQSRDNELLTHVLSGKFYLYEDLYIIGALDRIEVSSLDHLIQNNFRWIPFRYDREPISGLLLRHLNRKLIDASNGVFPNSSDPIKQAVDWICLCWIRLNIVLSRLGLQQLILGPRHFFTCATDSFNKAGILRWMSLCWNHAIAPGVEDAVLHRKSPGTAPPEHIAANTLGFLLQKAIIPDCPIDGNEFRGYFVSFRAYNEEIMPTVNTSSRKNEIVNTVEVRRRPKVAIGVDVRELNKSDGAESKAFLETSTDQNCFIDIARKVLEMLYIKELMRTSFWNNKILARLAPITTLKAEDRLGAVMQLAATSNSKFLDIFKAAMIEVRKNECSFGFTTGKNCINGTKDSISSSCSSLDSLTESRISSDSPSDSSDSPLRVFPITNSKFTMRNLPGGLLNKANCESPVNAVSDGMSLKIGQYPE